MSDMQTTYGRWTSEQWDAIQSNGANLLISAAAGSGKTAVLVERILRLCAEKGPYGTDIDKLLVVTFTNAAAAEMKSRLRTKLTELLFVQKENAHLQKQLALLGQASISTIDALCQRIVRENFMLLDIDPAFQVADQVELEFLKQEALDAVFERLYKEDSYFPILVESFCEHADDGELRGLILKIHHFLEAERNPQQWLEEKSALYNIKESSLSQTFFGKSAYSLAMEDLAYAHKQLQRALKIAQQPHGPAAYINCLLDESEMLQALLNCADYDQLAEAFLSVGFSRLPAAKKSEADESLIEQAKEHRTAAKELVNKVRGEFFFKPAGQMANDMRNLAPILQALSNTVQIFSETLMEYKKERRILSFADIKLLCYQTLVQNGEYTAVAKEYRKKFDYVMIDEYQDTNDVEEGILDAVSRNADGVYNRFMVGDVKQSIYRFRRSNPQLFNEKSHAYGEGIATGGKLVTLHRNFRSRPLILQGINYIFSQVMNAEAAEIDYDKNAELIPGADYAGMPDEPVEVFLIETYKDEEEAGTPENEADALLEAQELNALETEALFIADKIRALVIEEQFHVKEDGVYRPARFSDVAILMRAGKKKGSSIMSALASKGIPAFSEGKTGYFMLTEISDILSLLQVIDNPLQEIPLITLLTSAIYKFTPDDLLAIRSLAPEGSLFDAIKRCALSDEADNSNLQARTASFLEKLALYRKKSAELPISRLLLYLYEDSGYLIICGGMENGRLRQANLYSLINIARDFERSKLENLFHFVRHIQRLKESDSLGVSNAIDDHADVVRIMTIHKSKGLEFPIVFLAGCGARLNISDSNDKLLLHSELGYGAQYLDYQLRTKSEALPKYILRRKMRHEALSEELRLLYVAMTRACEKLFISGCVGKDAYARLQKWLAASAEHGGAFTSRLVTNAGSYLDFIMPPLLRHPDIAPLLTDWGLIPARRPNEYESVSRFTLTALTLPLFQPAAANTGGKKTREDLRQQIADFALSASDAEADDSEFDVDKFVNWQYNYQADVENPVKISISEIKTQLQSAVLGNGDAATYTALPLDFNTYATAHDTDLLMTGMATDRGNSTPELLFPRPQFMMSSKKLSPAEEGTAIHSVLSAVAFGETKTAEDVEAIIARLKQKNILTKEDAAVVPVPSIAAFLQSDIAQRIAKAIACRKEAPFVIGLPPQELLLPPSDEIVLVHGIVDCYFEEEDGIVLLDYKTDRVKDNDYRQILTQYQTQMNIYKKAVTAVTGKPVKEAYLYLVRYNKFLTVPI